MIAVAPGLALQVPLVVIFSCEKLSGSGNFCGQSRLLVIPYLAVSYKVLYKMPHRFSDLLLLLGVIEDNRAVLGSSVIALLAFGGGVVE